MLTSLTPCSLEDSISLAGYRVFASNIQTAAIAGVPGLKWNVKDADANWLLTVRMRESAALKISANSVGLDSFAGWVLMESPAFDVTHFAYAWVLGAGWSESKYSASNRRLSRALRIGPRSPESTDSDDRMSVLPNQANKMSI
jgi:hypothetical protein